MSQTNLFNTLSDEEQEIVAGGVTTFAVPTGVVSYEAGASGFYQFTSNSGYVSKASWTPNSFSYNGITYKW